MRWAFVWCVMTEGRYLREEMNRLVCYREAPRHYDISPLVLLRTSLSFVAKLDGVFAYCSTSGGIDRTMTKIVEHICSTRASVELAVMMYRRKRHSAIFR